MAFLRLVLYGVLNTDGVRAVWLRASHGPVGATLRPDLARGGRGTRGLDPMGRKRPLKQPRPCLHGQGLPVGVLKALSPHSPDTVLDLGFCTSVEVPVIRQAETLGEEWTH